MTTARTKTPLFAKKVRGQPRCFDLPSVCSDLVFTAAPCLCSARDSAVVMTEDVREQLLEASSATKKAFNSYRRDADPEEHFNSADGQPSAGDKNQDDGEMSFVIVIMQPILRFLQLLCENHNRDLQV